MNNVINLSSIKSALVSIKTEKISRRIRSLILLLEAYVTDDTIDHVKYPFHLFYLIKFSGKVNQERYVEKHHLRVTSFNAQITTCADLLMLTAGMNAFEKGMVVEFLGSLSLIANKMNEVEMSSKDRIEVIEELIGIVYDNIGNPDHKTFDTLGIVALVSAITAVANHNQWSK